MERLKRLRSKPTAATAPPPKERPPAAKPRGAPRASSSNVMGPLDLEKLNSKLEQYAKTRSAQEDEEGDGGEALSAHKEEPLDAASHVAQKSTTVGEGAAEQEKELQDDLATDLPEMNPKHDVVPPEAAPVESNIAINISSPEKTPSQELDEPSDFEVFLHHAHEDERRREENGQHSLPRKSTQEPQLNVFYSNPWSGPEQPASPAGIPKLAEIQESEEDVTKEGDVADGPTAVHVEQQQQVDEDSGSREASLSLYSTDSDSGTEPEESTLAQTSTTGGNTNKPTAIGRHVSFTEPMKLRDRSGSHSSAYHGRGHESPKGQTAVSRRKSIRKMMADYIRQL